MLYDDEKKGDIRMMRYEEEEEVGKTFDEDK